MGLRRTALLLAVAAASSLTASATTMIYTSAAAFEAAAGTLTTVTFSAPYEIALGTTYSQAGVSFDVGGGCANVSGGCLPSASLALFPGSTGTQDTGGYAETSLFDDSYGPAELNITLAPTNAIGVFFGDAAGYNGSGATITLSDGTVYNFTATQNLFFGAISTSTNLTSLDIVAPHDFGLATPEVQYGTPEPGTLTLLGIGGLAGLSMKKRAKA